MVLVTDEEKAAEQARVDDMIARYLAGEIEDAPKRSPWRHGVRPDTGRQA